MLGASRLQCEKTAPPKQGAGGCAPAGGTASPPVPKNVGGWARWDNGVRHHESPLLSLPPHSGQTSHPYPRMQGQPRKRSPLHCSKVSMRSPSALQAGCRGRSPRRGTGGVPLFLKTLEGGAGGIAAHAKTRPSVPIGGRTPESETPATPPIAKCERVCYSTPMKSATGPLLFLGACRIHLALWANHGESPCGRGAEGTPQGARPSEEGWDRSECRCKAQALWSHPTP